MKSVLAKFASLAITSAFAFGGGAAHAGSLATPSLSISDVSVTEGNSLTRTATFTIVLSAAQTGPVLVDVATANGTATAGSDYVAKSTAGLRIPAGTTSKTFAVSINGDTTMEPDETFMVNLSNASGATIADGQGVGTIQNDDGGALPTISIADASVAEGNSGTKSMNFTVSLSAAASSDVTFGFATEDGTAQANTDYYATTTLGITIPAGQTSKTISVPIVGDLNIEANETFTVRLQSLSGADWGDFTAIGTITNDDTTPPVLNIADQAWAEGNQTSSGFPLAITLSATNTNPISFDITTSNGTATAGSDYTALTQHVTIPANSSEIYYLLWVGGDTTFESDETIIVTLSNAVNATIGDGQSTFTILNDDVPPRVWPEQQTYAEGNSGPHDVSLEVRLEYPVDYPVSVDYATQDGTAYAGSDYVATSGTVTIPAGQSVATYTVTVNGDTTAEANEFFYSKLSNPVGATLDGDRDYTQITDDDGGGDAFPVLDVSNDVWVDEGDSGTKTADFTVTLSKPVAYDVTFNLDTTDVTASAGSDYVALHLANQVIPAGTTTKTFQVTVNGDTITEGTAEENWEEFTLDPSHVEGATTGRPGHGYIKDDEGPKISVNDVSLVEGNSGTQTMTFTVSVAPVASVPVKFDIAAVQPCSSGCYAAAQPGSDFVASSLTGQTIPAGQGSKTFSVTINGDTDIEPDETFEAELSNVTGATVVKPWGIGTITTDDFMPPPNIQVQDPYPTIEGQSGSHLVNVYVGYAPSTFNGPITLSYATADGTATAGSDYTAVSGTITIPADQGGSILIAQVPVFGDTTPEADETFYVNISNVTPGIQVNDSQAVATITNDDSPPTLYIDNYVQYPEGNSGQHDAAVVVKLTGAVDYPVTFDYATADYLATAGSDYAACSGSMTIPAGATSATINVPIYGDTSAEPDEYFKVKISNVSGAYPAADTFYEIIQNDDGEAPTLSIADVSITEGDSGTKAATVVVSLTGPSDHDVSFSIAALEAGATANVDFVPWTLTNQVIPAGQTSKSFTVLIKGDTLPEYDEQIMMNLNDIQGVLWTKGQSYITIVDDDAAQMPDLTVSDVSISEGNSGQKVAQFTIQLSHSVQQQVTFNWATVDGTAQSGSDYAGASSNLFINPGSTSIQLGVLINGDTTVEADENFKLVLSNVQFAHVVDGEGQATILNDDGNVAPLLTIGDVSIAEGNSGTKTATFTVSLSAAQAGAVLVDVATANGTATAGSDYVAKTQTGLRIPAGATSKTFAVTINGDTTSEPDETFTVNLSNASSGVTIGDGVGLGTITNDDAVATPTLSIGDASVSEGNSGTKTLTFTVSLSPAASGTVSYDIATSNGTATAGSDYVASTLTGQQITAGQTSKTFVVTINGDTATEANETFNVTLSNVSGATLGDGSAVGTITNDDGGSGPTLSIGDVSIAEGNALTKQATFTVTLSAAASTAVTYNIATANGTAIAPTDYTAKSLTGQSIPAGTTSKTFVVVIKGDKTVEPNETFLVNVTNAAGATIADGQATGTITNDDAAALSIARFDAKGIVDDVDDGNRQPQIAPGEYATLLANSATTMCRRAPNATVIAVEGIEHKQVLADLADAANTLCASKPKYTAVMADVDSRGFLIAMPAKGEVGISVLGQPEVNANAKSTSVQILGAGHLAPVTIMIANGSSKSLATQLTQRAKAQPNEALVLLGANAANGMLDLSQRELASSKLPLPPERLLVNPALLGIYGEALVQPIRLSPGTTPAQVLQLH